MPSIEQYSEVVRLAGDLRRALARIYSGGYHPQMLSATGQHAKRIVQLAPEFTAPATEMRDAARMYFGADRTAVQRTVGGAVALRASIAGALNKIDTGAQRKGGQAKRVGLEKPIPSETTTPPSVTGGGPNRPR